MNLFSYQYRFADFTIGNYKNLLKLALKNYSFSFFKKDFSYPNKTIILRHDIEFSVQIALRMAEIENSLGIKATYFVQLHGDFYNALEKRTLKQLKRIESLGHKLALHFDIHFWDIEREDRLNQYLKIDESTFTQYLETRPEVFSFHNNNSFTLSCEKEEYAGMINVYSKRYKNDYGYCADSTGYWRYEILEDMLRTAKDNILQILIHDGMWQDEVLPPRRRVFKVIDEHAAFLKRSYDGTLLKFGAKNIDWEGDINNG